MHLCMFWSLYLDFQLVVSPKLICSLIVQPERPKNSPTHQLFTPSAPHPNTPTPRRKFKLDLQLSLNLHHKYFVLRTLLFPRVSLRSKLYLPFEFSKLLCMRVTLYLLSTSLPPRCTTQTRKHMHTLILINASFRVDRQTETLNTSTVYHPRQFHILRVLSVG